MVQRVVIPLAGVLLAAAGVTAHRPQPGKPVVKPEAATGAPQRSRAPRMAIAALPLSFEPNRGQADPAVRFLARARGYRLFLTDREAVMVMTRRPPDEPPMATNPGPREQTVVRMSLVGGQPPRRSEALERVPGVSNYLLGEDPSRWITDVPHYARVRQRDVYPGIDLVFYGNPGELEYDFVVAPGANVNAIRLRFEGVESLRVDDGDLVLAVRGGELRQRRPRIYQDIGGRRVEVAGGYRLEQGEVRFQLARYDGARRLVIDPVLAFANYIGGGGFDSATGFGIDQFGNSYICGETDSINFPIVGGVSGTLAGFSDAFVSKVSADGRSLVYSTYLGGSGFDQAWSLAVTPTGRVFVTGRTQSANFPRVNAIRMTGVSNEGFVTSLNTAGNAFVYSTYLGGSGEDFGYGIAIDSQEAAYITGHTSSSNFHFLNGFDRDINCVVGSPCGDAFVTKLASNGALVYSSFLGGTSSDTGWSIAVDSTGAAYVGGNTQSTGFGTTQGAFQPRLAGGYDGFIVKVAPPGNARVFSTFFGGTGYDLIRAIAVDGLGNAYVTGWTNSAQDFPRRFAFQNNFGGGSTDTFVAKIDASGQTLGFSTFLGGSGNDGGLEEGWVTDITVERTDVVVVTGGTTSPDFPLVNPTDRLISGSWDAFISRIAFHTFFRSGTTKLLFSTFFGGSGFDYGAGVAVDAIGQIYLGGTATQSFYFPNPKVPPQFGYGGGSADAFVAKLANANLRVPSSTIRPASLLPDGEPVGYEAAGASGKTAAGGGGLRRLFNSVAVGSSITISQTIINLGPETSDNVSIGSSIPTGLTLLGCSATGASCAPFGATFQVRYPELAVDQSVTVEYTVRINQGVPNGTEFTTILEVNSDTNDFDFEDNSIATTFTAYTPVAVTVTSTPPGLSVKVDDVAVTTPFNSTWLAGSSHTLEAVSPQTIGNSRYTFAGWSNGGAQFQTVTTPTSGPITYTAGYSTAHRLTRLVEPLTGGAITPTPSSADGFYSSGTSVQLLAAPATGFVFSNWSGAVTGTANPTTVTMSGPRTVTANFSPVQQAPVAVSMTPNAGAGTTQTFSFVFTDGNGFSDLTTMYALFNSGLNAVNGCFIEYNRVTNLMRLAADNAASWMPIALLPGAAGTVGNSFCSLNGAGAAAVGLNDQFTVTVPVTFTPLFKGPRVVHLYAADLGGLNSGWQNRGSWTVPNNPPTVTYVSPNTGAGTTQSFRFTFSDPNGWQDLSTVYGLVQDGLSAVQACFFEYNRVSNQLRLSNDTATDWAPTVLTPGQAGTVSNSQCSINGAPSAVSGFGTNLDVVVPITFTQSFGGVRSIYGFARDLSDAASAFTALGTWTVNVTNQPPSVLGTAPASTTAASGTLATFFSDPNSYADLSLMYILVRNGLSGAQACFVEYHRASHRFRLANDAGTDWLPTTVTPGVAGSASNSQCTIQGSGSAVSGFLNTLGLYLNVSFSPAFAGPKQVYGFAQDKAGAQSPWTQAGTWTVP